MRNQVTETVFGNLLDQQFTLAAALKLLDSRGLLALGELTEMAVSEGSGVDRCVKMTANIDLPTGWQIKYAKSYKQKHGSYVATISRNSTAPILAVIDEQCTGKQYYMHIPYKAHEHLSGNTIGVNFGSDGCNLKTTWMPYRVEKFTDLCDLARINV